MQSNLVHFFKAFLFSSGSLTGVNSSSSEMPSLPYPQNVAPPISIMSRSMMLGPPTNCVTPQGVTQRQRHAHRYREEMDVTAASHSQQPQPQQLFYPNPMTASPFQYPGTFQNYFFIFLNSVIKNVCKLSLLA